MAVFREGKVVEIVESRPGLVRARVEIGTRDGAAAEIVASAFPDRIGPVAAGARVGVNTLGLDLELGTGGEGFILWNLDAVGTSDVGEGHIVKLRYTPLQTNVVSAEAPESEHHASLKEADDLGGTPVVACGLHSLIAGVAAGVKAASPGVRLAYAMGDGGALPLAWSDLVAELRDAGLIDVTCTYGHAFGGDIEAVNVFSALTACKIAGRADVIVTAMGPGGVGTHTKLGFTGIEQGQVLDAAGALGGRAIACLRVSFDDARDRHRGISHHGVTTLMVAAQRRATVVLPLLPGVPGDVLEEQCERTGIAGRHDVVEADGRPGVDLLKAKGLDPATMGRRLSHSPEPFLAAAAAGAVAAGTLA